VVSSLQRYSPSSWGFAQDDVSETLRIDEQRWPYSGGLVTMRQITQGFGTADTVFFWRHLERAKR